MALVGLRPPTFLLGGVVEAAAMAGGEGDGEGEGEAEGWSSCRCSGCWPLLPVLVLVARLTAGMDGPVLAAHAPAGSAGSAVRVGIVVTEPPCQAFASTMFM